MRRSGRRIRPAPPQGTPGRVRGRPSRRARTPWTRPSAGRMPPLPVPPGDQLPSRNSPASPCLGTDLLFPTHLPFPALGQRRVERAEIEDAAQVDWLEQAERLGLRSVARQRGRIRVVGEGDLLERCRHDARLKRLAGEGGDPPFPAAPRAARTAFKKARPPDL